MARQQALIVDDEADIRELLQITLSTMGLDCDQAGSVKEGRKLLAKGNYDLCLTDMRLPDGQGIELVKEIQTNHPKTPVAVITAYGSMESAVETLKAGAFDYVSKPVDLKALRDLVNSALRLREDRDVRERRSRHTMIGDSSPMRRLRGTIEKLARSQAPVFIHGESGTGKELAARLIHDKGPRAEQSFVAVNCGAIPADLMESEFFGHKRGSFTGAIADKPGLFQAADGGTLFLDEIAELPFPMQVKLLRAIQERAVRPVGSHEEVRVDVRILSATHHSLNERVAKGTFREDLYYRINVIELEIPPLRERPEDIPSLAEHCLKQLEQRSGRPSPGLSKEAIAALQAYTFPGNVRELENLLERASSLCEGNEIAAIDLHLNEGPREAPPPVTGKNLDEYLAELERSRITEALEETRWNKTEAAKRLGVSFRSLRYRMEKLGIE
ncbi:MAG: sigma-54-dependent Fis family transcriptional regulator [Chromatiales bacterium]|nr:sigma-54-dependent Fis family transcriptional regulator [Chromatiales bacterium]